MKSALLCLIAIAFALLVSSCSDDPVSTKSSYAVPSYHGTLLSLDTRFEQVCGFAPDDVYAAGALVFHHDGNAWAPVELPDDLRYLQIAVALADGKFALSDGRTIFLRDKNKWTKIAGPDHSIDNLWGTSSDLYGVGWEGLSHFDGTSWTPMVLPGDTESPFLFAGRSSSDIITTGRWGAIYHFDGSEWSTAHVDSFYRYSSLAMTQSGRVFAADFGRVFEFKESGPEIILEDELDNSVLCADGDVLYAGGPVRYDHYDNPEFAIQRYSNGQWQQVAKEKGRCRGFWAGHGTLVAAGDENLLWRGTEQGGSLDASFPRRAFLSCAFNIDDAIYAAGRGAYRYQNGVWTDLKKEYISENTAWSIVGRTQRDIYAVGDLMIMHYDGDKWSWINGGFGTRLTAAWVDASGDLLAAGGTQIFRKHHDDWFNESIPGDPRGINAMWGDDNAVFAVGSEGLIAVRRHGEWQSMASGTSSELFTIWGFDDTHVYAAGENNNELCLYNGRTWQPVPITSADLENFQSIWGKSPSDFWAADWRGVVAHYDGNRWTELERFFPRGLRAVCGNSRETLAFGDYGIISYRR